MFGKLFKKNEKAPQVNDVTLVSPVSGELVPLEEVDDPVFAQRMMGDGIAVDPANGEVVSPLDAKVVQVFPTNHAVGLQAANGAEILIHIGLETVSLNGEGFTAYVKEGAQVKQGDRLISFDMGIVREKAKSTVIPIIVTNTDDMGSIEAKEKREVIAGQDEILVVKK